MSIKVDQEELKKRLTPLQYEVTQNKATEVAGTGIYDKVYDKGVYLCIVCDRELFSSNNKYDSGCGWPAFTECLEQGNVTMTKDTSGGQIRTEVCCSNCGSHLGHVFNDGPKPKKTRYCINSASMKFIPAEERK